MRRERKGMITRATSRIGKPTHLLDRDLGARGPVDGRADDAILRCQPPSGSRSRTAPSPITSMTWYLLPTLLRPSTRPPSDRECARTIERAAAPRPSCPTRQAQAERPWWTQRARERPRQERPRRRPSGASGARSERRAGVRCESRRQLEQRETGPLGTANNRPNRAVRAHAGCRAESTAPGSERETGASSE